jgi:hypothetical protein
MPLDTTSGQVFTLYCPGRCHGHHFLHKTLSCGIAKLLAKASIQKTRHGPSTQLIKATSCVKRLDATIKTEGLSYFSSYQMLTMEKLAKLLIINEACKKVEGHDRPWRLSC